MVRQRGHIHTAEEQGNACRALQSPRRNTQQENRRVVSQTCSHCSGGMPKLRLPEHRELGRGLGEAAHPAGEHVGALLGNAAQVPPHRIQTLCGLPAVRGPKRDNQWRKEPPHGFLFGHCA
jgi:hypothetical protein